jgi:glycerate kinase
MVEELEAGMERYARLVQEAVARELVNLPGVGAAGGLGFGLVAFLQARITPGIEVVMEAVNFDARLRWCDLVVTGEGRLDAQTSRGKTVSGVIWRARGEKKPVIVLAGAVDEEVARARGKHRENLLGDNAACFSIAPGPMGREEALARTEENLFFMAAQVGVLLRNLSSPSLD